MAKEPEIPKERRCPNCGSGPSEHEVRLTDPRAREGDVYCKKCGSYVRMWNP